MFLQQYHRAVARKLCTVCREIYLIILPARQPDFCGDFQESWVQLPFIFSGYHFQAGPWSSHFTMSPVKPNTCPWLSWSRSIQSCVFKLCCSEHLDMCGTGWGKGNKQQQKRKKTGLKLLWLHKLQEKSWHMKRFPHYCLLKSTEQWWQKPYRFVFSSLSVPVSDENILKLHSRQNPCCVPGTWSC